MFRIGKSNLHGVGWFATRDIRADTPIFDEQVSIRMPVDLSRDSGDPKLLQDYVSELPKDQQASFLALDGPDLLDKLWMNGCPLIDYDNDPLGIGPRKDLGIYLKCARLNHSCVPNACRASDEGNIMSVVAQKDIQVGEEITISYMDDNFAAAKDREKQMRNKIRVGRLWKGCRCSLCIGPNERKQVSDQRRIHLSALRAQLMRGAMSKMEFVTSFLPLMSLEGLPISLMGTAASMKMMALLGGIDVTSPTSTQDSVNAYCFQKGVGVILHKLKAKPELNGKNGTVVYPLNTTTGRVGILLDSPHASDNLPIAVKPENLCLLRRGPSGAV